MGALILRIGFWAIETWTCAQEGLDGCMRVFLLDQYSGELTVTPWEYSGMNIVIIVPQKNKRLQGFLCAHSVQFRVFGFLSPTN